MIERDPEVAAGSSYELIVIGGGIYGACLALEAARRGLRPLLLERADFGGETSWNSLRIVHGGLRYLQTLDLPRFRESVAERAWMFRHFPDQVQPLPCLMPLYGNGARRPSIMRIALALNDFLSRKRNVDVREDRSLPDGQTLSAAETVKWFPGVDREGLCGGALWHDGTMPDSQRLLVEMLRWATASGAVCLNYVEATGLAQDGGLVRGVSARDLHTGDELTFRSPVVINCTGPWCRELAERFDRDIPELFPLSIAFNLLLDRPALSEAALAVAPKIPGGRTYFLHPWKGKIFAGTYHVPWTGSREQGAVDDTMVADMLGDLNRAVPGLDATPGEVLRVHWGFLPAKHEGTEELASREQIRHHADGGGPQGLFSVSGVKYTTARLVAAKTLRTIADWQGRPLPSPGDAARPEPFPSLSLTDFEALVDRDAEAAAQHVARLVREECVLHLDDLMLRRTDWGSDPRAGRLLANRVARQLGWDDARIENEINQLDAAIA